MNILELKTLIAELSQTIETLPNDMEVILQDEHGCVFEPKANWSADTDSIYVDKGLFNTEQTPEYNGIEPNDWKLLTEDVPRVLTIYPLG